MLKYEDGGGSGPAVLFVHGWHADRSVWSGVIEALGPNVRSIAVDLRGYGDSNALPGPYTIERFAADVAEVIESLGVAPAIVAGHSMGGKIATRLALDAPGTVRGLILIAPVPMSAAGFSPKGEARLRGTAGDPVAVKDWLARTIEQPPDARVLDILRAAAAKTPREVALESFESWAFADFAGETRSVTVPVLIVEAEQDATLADGIRRLAELLRTAGFTLCPERRTT